jgi:predicted dinucleotide-binding enzyme
MGQAIAGVVTKGGNTADLIGHGDADKAVSNDVVVLAVPYPAVADVIAERGDQLAGKVVVDITNPLNFETFDSRRPRGRFCRRRDRRCPAAVARGEGL